MEYNTNNSAFRIGTDNNLLFQIDNDGTIWYKLNNEIKRLDNEKEMGMILLYVISGRYGNKFESKEELFSEILKSYRNGKIDDILK